MFQISFNFSHIFLIILILISIINYTSSYELSEEKIESLNTLINTQMKQARLKTLGLIITTSNGTLYQNIFGENETITTKSPFILGSVTKSFTALATLYLIFL